MIQGFSGGLLNRELIYQTDLPSFQRDFASLKTLDHGTGPAITFTRASNATFFDANGTLQTAANDTPRFDHSATGSSLGLLIEEARTNSYQRSAEFDNAYWTKTALLAFGSGSTANNHAAPDGTTTADTIIEDTTAATHEVTRAFTYVNGTTYTLSVFVKAAGRTWLGIRVIPAAYAGANRQAYFNLSNGTIGTTAASTTATIQALPNGWYRCSVTAAATVDGSGDSRIWMTTADNVASHTGDGASGLHLWGAQLEVGAFPTSYIPTTTAAATRSADSAVVTPISSFYNQAEGTLFAEYICNIANVGIVGFTDNSVTNRFIVITSNSPAGAPIGNVRISNNTEASITVGSTPTSTEIIKFALTGANNDFQAARGGTLGTADTSGGMPTLTHLQVGVGGGSSNRMTGHIRKLAYWPKRLTNTLLEQLTT
jgi:hypothetical protein